MIRKRTPLGFSMRALSLLACVMAFAFGTAFAAESLVSTAPLAVDDPLPRAALIDQLGRPFELSAPLTRPLVVAFIYTRCRDATMCPLVSAKFALLQRSGIDADLLEITLDPVYDRPPVLRRYGALYGADPSRWRIATGDPGVIAELISRFGLYLQRTTGDTIVHSERLVVVDRRGRISGFTEGAAWTVADVRALVAASDAPGRRLRTAFFDRLSVFCGQQTARLVVENIPIFLASLVPVLLAGMWIAALALRHRRTAAP